MAAAAAFLRCDAETRARRTLVKMVSVIDMAHASLSDSDRRFFAILGESGKLSETAYPQMQARNVMLHPPSFMYAMFSIVKVFMSKKQLDKQAIVRAGKERASRERAGGIGHGIYRHGQACRGARDWSVSLQPTHPPLCALVAVPRRCRCAHECQGLPLRLQALRRRRSALFYGRCLPLHGSRRLHLRRAE